METNPFNPGFGKVPPIYLGREHEIDKYLSEIRNPNSPFQTTLVYGMRGTGKTAFITDVSRSIEKWEKWTVVNLALGGPLLPSLADALYEQAGPSLKKALQAIQGVKISAFGISLDVDGGSPAGSEYRNLLMTMLRELKRTGDHLLITIDEVKATPEVSEFASLYQLMVREEDPVALLMTGLPQNVSALQNNDVLTFLLRAGRIVLAPLDLWEVKSSYAKAFRGHRSVSEDLLLSITKLTGGYAYAFQLLGYDLWEESETEITEQTLEEVMPLYRNDLYRNAYLKIYQSLTPREQDFINAMSDLVADGSAVSVDEIGKKLHKEKNYISVYRRRLIDTQVVFSPRRGYLQFSLPLFADFVKENHLLFET